MSKAYQIHLDKKLKFILINRSYNFVYLLKYIFVKAEVHKRCLIVRYLFKKDITF